jgi:DNA-binding NarL/FixJ family response regulator
LTLRVVVAEDNYLVREGLVRLLSDGDDIEVLEAVRDAPALLEAAKKPEVQAVLTDIRMPPNHSTDGIEAALAIRKRRPEVGVVVLSQHVAGAYAFDLFVNGTAGLAYLLKERVGDREELVRALQTTVAGGSVVDSVVVEHLLARERRVLSSPLAQLTERELAVLSGMAEGRTNPAIAKKLFISESAVSKHIAAIFAKLGLNEYIEVDRRVSAVITYLRDRTEA